MDKLRYIVIGGLPEPSGGVTVFNGELVELLLKKGHEVVVFDQNVGSKQTRFENADIRTWRRGAGLLFHVWVALGLLRERADRVIFHMSNTSSLVGSIVPLVRGMRCAIFFHNGEIETKDLSHFQRLILLWLMGRIDRIFIMSPTQEKGLIEMGYPMHRVCRIVPVLQLTSMEDKKGPPLIERPMHILACGHEERIYNFEFAVRLAQKLTNAEVHLYLYGTHVDHGYLDEIKALDLKGSLRIFRNKNKETFLEGLRSARLFVRPNLVDSFGVSVIDALHSGTPVVASDICDRAAGATLFKTGCYKSFQAAALSILSQNEIPLTDSQIIENTLKQLEAMIQEDEQGAV